MNYRKLLELLKEMPDALLDEQITVQLEDGSRGGITPVITLDEKSMFFVAACVEDN